MRLGLRIILRGCGWGCGNLAAYSEPASETYFCTGEIRGKQILGSRKGDTTVTKWQPEVWEVIGNVGRDIQLWCGFVVERFCGPSAWVQMSLRFFFFLNIIWQQVHPLLHSFPFWVKAHTLNNGTKQRVETNSRNQRHSELEDSLRDLLKRLQSIPTWCHAALGTLAHGPRKRKGGRGVLLPYMLTGMGGYYENRGKH